MEGNRKPSLISVIDKTKLQLKNFSVIDYICFHILLSASNQNTFRKILIYVSNFNHISSPIKVRCVLKYLPALGHNILRVGMDALERCIVAT